MALITYEDKEFLNENSQILEKNKVTADNLNQIKDSINSLATALGLDTDTFTPGTAYDVGDMVIYNHIIYECNLAHVAEEFESEKWDIVPIIVN